MLRTLGTLCLAVGGALLLLTNPWMFLGRREPGLIDFTEVFWYGQWAGCWLLVSSLVLYGLAWRLGPVAGGGRSLVLPGLALGLGVAFVLFSMPEKSNLREWRKGALGARVYFRTKARLREDAGGLDAVPERFAGRWRAEDGSVTTISRTETTETREGRSIGQSAATCLGARFAMDYELVGRMELFTILRDGTPQLQALYADLPNRHYPVLVRDCGQSRDTFVLIDRGRIVRVNDGGSAVLLRS